MSNNLGSALFSGVVTHARLRPRQHRLAYRVSSLLLDLDELDGLDRRLRLFSVDRFNLFSFYSKDRSDGSGGSLRNQIERSMAAAHVAWDGGPIRLLTMPRILGWSFNPLSVFFCYRRSGEVAAILWQVDNTFGERHGYFIPVSDQQSGEIRQSCDKCFYVSPFMDMDLKYDFRVRPPGETFSIVINASDANGIVLNAHHRGKRVELTDRALLSVFASLPLQTLSVAGGIGWEALKIWWKGVAIRRRPSPSLQGISIVSAAAHDSRGTSE